MDKTGKIIWVAAIILISLTAAMNVLGGVGTSCVAFSDNVGYRMAFKQLMDYRWLYQIFVVTTVLVGLAGIWATIHLFRGGKTAYRNAVILLVVGAVLGGVHYFTSLTLRGAAAPANVKFYLNALTLIVFLLLSVPGIKDKVNFNNPKNTKGDRTTTAGMAAIVAGLAVLTVFSWAGPSHSFTGQNWVYVFYTPLILSGALLILGGVGCLAWTVRDAWAEEAAQQTAQRVTGQQSPAVSGQ